jgi:hypothetical protein
MVAPNPIQQVAEALLGKADPALHSPAVHEHRTGSADAPGSPDATTTIDGR